MAVINRQSFWETDLDKIEATFLPKGKIITDLPRTLDSRVPEQGSVLLSKSVDVNAVVNKPSLIKRIIHALF